MFFFFFFFFFFFLLQLRLSQYISTGSRSLNRLLSQSHLFFFFSFLFFHKFKNEIQGLNFGNERGNYSAATHDHYAFSGKVLSSSRQLGRERERRSAAERDEREKERRERETRKRDEKEREEVQSLTRLCFQLVAICLLSQLRERERD